VPQQSTSLNSKSSLIQRLRRGRNARARFVDSNVSKTIAFQTRSLRDKEGWSQQRLAEEIGSNQNAIYRAENPNYGKQTLTTLKKIADAFDVALIVRFVPFSELVDWVTGTPRRIEGLTTSALAVENFATEEAAGFFENQVPVADLRVGRGAAESARTQFELAAAASDSVGRAALTAAMNAAIPPPSMQQGGRSIGAMASGIQ
jgi:transcriptional regulator with XRE-family HTH domain